MCSYFMLLMVYFIFIWSILFSYMVYFIFIWSIIISIWSISFLYGLVHFHFHICDCSRENRAYWKAWGKAWPMVFITMDHAFGLTSPRFSSKTMGPRFLGKAWAHGFISESVGPWFSKNKQGPRSIKEWAMVSALRWLKCNFSVIKSARTSAWGCSSKNNLREI